jgi:hypothetical protein
MENTYQKGQSNGSAVPIKLPKNIRQVGSVLYHGRIIYVEDYVMTFVKQLADIDPGELRVAVFLGYSVKTEEAKALFIKGAVEMKRADLGTSMTLTDEGWTSVYENIKKYFTDVEIIGWALVGPGFYLESNDKIRKIHGDNFSGSDKILLKMDSMEREEAFYFCENSQLVKQPGYYLYYEKNEEMQNYMVEYKEEKIIREEEVYNDQTIKKIRNIIQDKKEVKDDRGVVRLLYAASSLLAIIVLVIAATMLDSYDKMKKMESALSTISQNLNVAGDSKGQEVALDNTADKSGKDPTGGTGADKTDGVKKAEGGTGGDSKAVPVDKVEGNVTPEPKATQKPEEEVSEAPTKAPESTPKPTKAAEVRKDKKDTDTKPASAAVKYYTVKMAAHSNFSI